MGRVPLSGQERPLRSWVSSVAPWLDRQYGHVPTPVCGTHVRIIANPRAGGHSHFEADLLAAIRHLRRYVPKVELRWTERPEHAGALAAQAVADGVTTVIAVGGDGTVNEIAQALLGTDVALGVLPMGTVNVWAREMGIPLTPLRAARVMIKGERRLVDVGRVNGRAFLLMVGVGLDGEVAHEVEQAHLGGLRKMIYYVGVVTHYAFHYHGARLRVHTDGQRRGLRALMVVVSNTRLYGGAFAFSPDARSNDGQLDVCIIQDQNLRNRMLVFTRLLLRQRSVGPRVFYQRGSHITIQGSPQMHVQVDGEDFCRLPVTITVEPQALHVLVPTRLPAHASLSATDIEHDHAQH